MKIGMIGAGTWGMALARLLGNEGHDVTVWSSVKEKADMYETTRTYPALSHMAVPETVHFTSDMRTVCEDKALLVFAVPSVYLRQTAVKAVPFIQNNTSIVSVSKGIEGGSLLTMTELIADVLKRKGISARISALTGPSHAEEVARDLPTAIVAAADTAAEAEYIQAIFSTDHFRVYTSTDVAGAELCGAMKNIIAIAAGILTGLGYGDNARAALITRGMAEITRLGLAMGCPSQTFYGLAGIGDMIVTTSSSHSRNHRFGTLIGAGKTTDEAKGQIGMVVEGLNALPAAMELSARYKCEMPIAAAVDRIIRHGADPAEEAKGLMLRQHKSE